MGIQDYCIGLKGVINAIHRITRALSGNVNSTTISDAVEEVAIAIENGGGGGGGGTTDHTKLQNRDSADQHPISAITGLETGLNEKADVSSTYTKSEVDSSLATKQEKLTAGDNITIENNTISADDEVFDAVYGETSYADVKAAIESGKVIRLVSAHLSFVPTLSYIQNEVCIFRLVRREDFYTYEVAPNGEWSFSSMFEYASTAQVAAKQDTLVSGTNIKTINNTSLLGGGNIDINEVFVAVYEQTSYADVKDAIDAHKAIMLDMPANNNQFCVTFATYTNGGNALMYAIYKSGDKPMVMTATLTPESSWTITHTDLQDKLISGTNIKTINNTSLLGSGNIDIQNTYSADEQIVGAWIDGKTIYQKTMTCAMPTGIVDGTIKNTFVPHGVSNIAQIVGCESVSKATSGNVGGEDGNMSVGNTFTHISADSYQINLSANIAEYSGKEYFVTFRYTKTT